MRADKANNARTQCAKSAHAHEQDRQRAAAQGEAGSALPNVLVMMATYNGESWVGEQIDSVLAQTGVDVTLRACDDCSSDGTYAILKAYDSAHSNVEVSQNDHNLGVCANFMQMVYDDTLTGYDYYAFCDQDDVWLPDKLKVAVQTIEDALARGAVRQIAGFGQPVLYASDLTNMDANLTRPRQELALLMPETDKGATILVRNWISGCTMAMNTDMAQLLRARQVRWPVKMHDWWAHLIAHFCATVVIDKDVSHILRRITGVNKVGEHARNEALKYTSAFHLMHTPKREYSAMATQLLDAYGDLMGIKDKKRIERFASYAKTPFSRLKEAASRDFWQPSRASMLLFRLKLLFGRL